MGCLFLNNNNSPCFSQLQNCYSSIQCHAINISPFNMFLELWSWEHMMRIIFAQPHKSTKSKCWWVRFMNLYILHFPKVILLPPVRESLPLEKTVMMTQGHQCYVINFWKRRAPSKTKKKEENGKYFTSGIKKSYVRTKSGLRYHIVQTLQCMT